MYVDVGDVELTERSIVGECTKEDMSVKIDREFRKRQERRLTLSRDSTYQSPATLYPFPQTQNASRLVQNFSPNFLYFCRYSITSYSCASKSYFQNDIRDYRITAPIPISQSLLLHQVVMSVLGFRTDSLVTFNSPCRIKQSRVLRQGCTATLVHGV